MHISTFKTILRLKQAVVLIGVLKSLYNIIYILCTVIIYNNILKFNIYIVPLDTMWSKSSNIQEPLLLQQQSAAANIDGYDDSKCIICNAAGNSKHKVTGK